MPDRRTVLTLAHSPDPDDVFMWWPITGMIDPQDHERVVRPPAIDTGRFEYRALPADIDVLNRRAVERADVEITAISIGTYPLVRERYALTSCGSSMGRGYGPKVVVRADSELTGDNLGERFRRGEVRLAAPGLRTTAFLVFGLMMGASGRGKVAVLPFDQIVPAVVEGRADAGLLIHQAQLTFEEMGLRQVADVGRWWLERTDLRLGAGGSDGLPLPLGGNAVRRDVDQRFGAGTSREIAGILLASIRHALARRDESVRYAMTFAPELDWERASRYIDLYVNELTLDARSGGGGGLEAMRRLLTEAHRLGLSPDPGEIDLVVPAGTGA